ncbi:hypothetical protein ACJX0J_019840 [Zea mays]
MRLLKGIYSLFRNFNILHILFFLYKANLPPIFQAAVAKLFTRFIALEWILKGYVVSLLLRSGYLIVSSGNPHGSLAQKEYGFPIPASWYASCQTFKIFTTTFAEIYL